MALLDQLGNTIIPNDSNNTGILTGDGQDIPLLGGDDDVIIEGSNNKVYGNTGNDILDGTNGTGNELYGGQQNDTIFGGADGLIRDGSGRDVIYAGSGNTISLLETGEGGRDIIYIATAEIPAAPNTITAFDPTFDVLRISLLPDLTAASQLTFTPTGANTTISFNGSDIAIVNGSITEANVAVITDATFVPPALPNSAPLFSQDTYTFDNSGIVAATDDDQDELTFSIVDGDNAALFSINANGQITIVADETTFPIGQTKSITVEVSDSLLSDTATVDVTRVPVSTFTLDVDGNGNTNELTDALLIQQYITVRGSSGEELSDPLITGLVGLDNNGNPVATVAQINDAIRPLYNSLDVDGNTSINELTDALLIKQYITVRGSSGDELSDPLITGLVGLDNNGNPVATVAQINDAIRPLYGTGI
jgi:hypothetical protein